MILAVQKYLHQWAEARNDFENGRTIKESGDKSGRYVGNLTEFALSRFLTDNAIQHKCVGSTCFEHDIEVGRKTIDAKAKARTYSYIDNPSRIGIDEAHVKEDQEEFDCDYYVFSSVHIPNGVRVAGSVHIVGWIEKNRFWDNCERVVLGQITSGNHKELADAGKLVYSGLRPMESLFDTLKNHITKCRFE